MMRRAIQSEEGRPLRGSTAFHEALSLTPTNTRSKRIYMTKKATRRCATAASWSFMLRRTAKIQFMYTTSSTTSIKTIGDMSNQETTINSPERTRTLLRSASASQSSRMTSCGRTRDTVMEAWPLSRACGQSRLIRRSSQPKTWMQRVQLFHVD